MDIPESDSMPVFRLSGKPVLLGLAENCCSNCAGDSAAIFFAVVLPLLNLVNLYVITNSTAVGTYYCPNTSKGSYSCQIVTIKSASLRYGMVIASPICYPYSVMCYGIDGASARAGSNTVVVFSLAQNACIIVRIRTVVYDWDYMVNFRCLI